MERALVHKYIQSETQSLFAFLKPFSTIHSPWRIVDDCGGAFTMGAIGGAVFQSIKGFRNAPSVS